MAGSWVVVISALVGAAVAMLAATQFVVAIWSLKADESGRQHATKLLEVLRKGSVDPGCAHARSATMTSTAEADLGADELLGVPRSRQDRRSPGTGGDQMASSGGLVKG
jgi:hypothetical protein